MPAEVRINCSDTRGLVLSTHAILGEGGLPNEECELNSLLYAILRVLGTVQKSSNKTECVLNAWLLSGRKAEHEELCLRQFSVLTYTTITITTQASGCVTTSVRVITS